MVASRWPTGRQPCKTIFLKKHRKTKEEVTKKREIKLIIIAFIIADTFIMKCWCKVSENSLATASLFLLCEQHPWRENTFAEAVFNRWSQQWTYQTLVSHTKSGKAVRIFQCIDDHMAWYPHMECDKYIWTGPSCISFFVNVHILVLPVKTIDLEQNIALRQSLFIELYTTRAVP